MPRRDGTGPMGFGPMTGRGLGVCSGINAPYYGAGYGRGFGRGFGLGYGRGLGFRRGFGRGFVGYPGAGSVPAATQKELLEEQKDILQKQLEAIDKQLENL